MQIEVVLGRPGSLIFPKLLKRPRFPYEESHFPYNIVGKMRLPAAGESHFPYACCVDDGKVKSASSTLAPRRRALEP